MRTSSSLFAAFLLVAATANAENIAPGASYSQDFDSLGSSATASLPSGWSATASTSIRAVTSTEYAAAGTATTQQGTGSGTTGGIYNWGESTNTTDRGVGFLATGSVTKTGNLYFSLTADGYIPDFTVSYDVKCYRNNSRQYQFQLYYSTDDGSTWTSAGGDFLTQPATNSSAYYAAPGVTSVASKTLDVSLTAGKTVILCWSYSVSSGTQTSNAQGLGIDNVVIVAGQSSGLDPLVTPSFEPVYPADATTNGFVLRWMAVENAVGYDLVVTNVAEQMEAGCQVSYSGPFPPDNLLVTATVTGLDADTLYAVAVRALATTDPAFPSTDYSDSDWSTPVEITTTLQGGLLRATLFNETFDSAGGNSWNRGSTAFDASLTDERGWIVDTIRRGPEGLLLGTQTKTGFATTREIVVSNGIENAAVVISFLAASYTSASTEGTLTLSNTVTGAKTVLQNLTPDSMSNAVNESLKEGTFYDFEATVPARFTLRFESLDSASDKRLLLDSIQVTQIYDPNYAVLAAPTGVTGSDIGKYGFTVSWNAVSNATGYAVWLNGAVAGSCASTSTTMQLTGLSDDTTYSVQVRALGDNLHYGDSPLSTEISVTTLADAQKISFIVTGAPEAPVYAGATVAFTVTAENEATHEPAEVSFSGIAGASFDSATGAFSWTPTESDVGSHTATFTSGTYSTNVTIEVLSPNQTATLFREDFSRFITQWNGTSNLAAITNPPPDNAGWTFALATRAPSSLRIGKDINKNEGEATAVGSALSPEIFLMNNLSSGTVTLSFEAAAYFKQTTAMHVVVLDAETGETVWTSTVLHLDAIEDGLAKNSTLASVSEGVHTNASFTVAGVPERFRLLFETVPGAAADHRLYLDTIVVSQSWDASVPALAAPTPAIGETSMDSLPVSWAAVSGATGYDLEARLADGSLAARATGVTGTSYTFTDLADGTAYSVRIRALGNGATAANSPWSDPSTGTTTVNPDRPEFAVSAGADAPVEAGTAKSFAVSAARDGTPVPVSFDELSPAPAVYGSPRFAGGTFSWTPTDDDAGQSFTATFRAGSYTTNVVFAVTARPPLAAPTITNTVLGVKNASFAWNAQSRATGYAVRLWRGSSDYAHPGACFEDFADCTMPKGWTGKGTGWYPTASDRNDRVQFDATGDELVSKLHSAPVTNLSFHLTLHGSSGDHPSTVSLLASTGGTAEGDWIPVETYSVAAGASGTKEKAFSESDGYRRFKWTFEKTGGNAGLGDIAAFHAGAGAKFVAGFGSAAEARDWGLSTTLSAERLRADTDYYLEVAALEGATEMTAVLHFRTLEANKATMLILK